MAPRTESPELTEVLKAREVAYGLLARLFGEEPDPAFLLELHQRRVFDTFLFAEASDAIQKGAQRVAASLAELETLGEAGFEALRSEYTRLFIGPTRLPAPPWESAYLTEERLLFQESTLEVRRAYRKYGLLPRNFPHEADDHISFELEFMARLCRLAQSEDEAARGQVLADQAAFMHEHLQRWVPAYARDLEASASTSFYQGAASLLRGFLEADGAFLDRLMDAGSHHLSTSVEV